MEETVINNTAQHRTYFLYMNQVWRVYLFNCVYVCTSVACVCARVDWSGVGTELRL